MSMTNLSKEQMAFVNQDAVTLHPNPGGRHFLVPVDQSEYSVYAAQFTFEHLVRENDCVTFLEALPYVEGFSGRKEQDPRLRSEAMVTLHKAIEVIRKETKNELIPFRVDVQFGDPRSLILEFSDKIKASMIVIGTRGLSTVRNLMLGSVSTYILNNARIPVIVARNPANHKKLNVKSSFDNLAEASSKK